MTGAWESSGYTPDHSQRFESVKFPDKDRTDFGSELHNSLSLQDVVLIDARDEVTEESQRMPEGARELGPGPPGGRLVNGTLPGTVIN